MWNRNDKSCLLPTVLEGAAESGRKIGSGGMIKGRTVEKI
jgi:hypothetical protein